MEWNARIQDRCGDLLVVRNPETYPIFLQSPADFLHRTVRDFLQDCYYDKLKELVAVQEGFNPLISLCRMMLFMLKSVPKVPDFRHRSSLNIFSLTDALLYYAHEVEKQTLEPETGWSPVTDVLDELDRVNCGHAGMLRGKHWTNARDLPRARGYEEYREGGKCNFLALAVQARLVG